jgi:phosphoglycolate phosphatase
MRGMPLPRVEFQAAILDLDGTLLDTIGDFDAALNQVLAELALPAVGRAFIERAVGKGSQHLIHATLAEVGAGAHQFEAAWALYQQRYQTINGRHSMVFPGVTQGLMALRAAGWRLACVTNKPGAFVPPLLAAKGLAGFFDVCFGGDAFERKKPDPLPLVKACEALASEPARTLMVGDSSNDAAAARAAGCPVVLMSYGYNHGEPVAAVDADAVIDRLDQLPALLRLNGVA